MEALPVPQGSRVRVWVMDEERFGLHTEMRRVWIRKGVRPEVRRQTHYEWDYLYGALDVVEGRAEFLHLPTVNWDCNRLFLEHLRTSDPEANHVVIADQVPPCSPELNPCELLWDVLKDTEGFANGLFESIENLRRALLPASAEVKSRLQKWEFWHLGFWIFSGFDAAFPAEALVGNESRRDELRARRTQLPATQSQGSCRRRVRVVAQPLRIGHRA